MLHPTLLPTFTSPLATPPSSRPQLQFYEDWAASNALARKIVLGRWGALIATRTTPDTELGGRSRSRGGGYSHEDYDSTDGAAAVESASEQKIWRAAMDDAQRHYTAEELDARQRARRLASSGKDATVRADDVQPFLQHAVYALGTSRRAHAFLNRLRWLALGSRKRLQHAMRDENVVSVTYVPGSMLDVFHRQIDSASAARRTSRQGAAPAAARAAADKAAGSREHAGETTGAEDSDDAADDDYSRGGRGDRDSHRGDRGGSSAVGTAGDRPLPYVTSAVSARAIVRDALPLNHANMRRLRPWLELLANQMRLELQQAGTPAEQLELFFRAKGLFQTAFPEQAAAWRWLAPRATGEQAGDTGGSSSAGVDAEAAAGRWVLRRAQWLQRLPRLVPEEDVGQARRIAHLLNTGYNADVLLETESAFAKVDDAEYVLLRLRRRADAIDGPLAETFRSLAVATYRQGTHAPGELWGALYSNGSPSAAAAAGAGSGNDAHNNGRLAGGNEPHGHSLGAVPETGNTIHSGTNGGGGSRRRAREGTMAYLLLRHLRVRGLRQEALGYLNYFSSLQRTLAYECATVAADGTSAEMAEARAHIAQEDEGTGGFLEDRYEVRVGVLHVIDTSGASIVYDHAVTAHERLEHELLALGSHYLRRAQGHDALDASLRRQSLFQRPGTAEGNTAAPDNADSPLLRSQQNSAASLTMHQPRRPSRPNSAARPRSNSLLRPGTGNRRESRPGSRGGAGLGAGSMPMGPVDASVDLALFGRSEVDRAAVLLELWLWEVEFQREKQRLLDCYRTALQNTVHLPARRRLVQVMVNILHRRPHYDFEAAYFAPAYHAACTGLRMERQLLTEMLNHQVEAAQQATAALAVAQPHKDPADTAATGLPLPSATPNTPAARAACISLQVGEVAGLPVEATRFHELCTTAEVVAAVPAALTFAMSEAARVLQPESALAEGRLQAAVCHEALLAWRQESQEQEQAQHWSDAIVHLNEQAVADNAVAVAQVAVKVAATAAGTARESGSLPVAVGLVAMRAMCNAVELVQQRHRLLLLQHESAVLVQLYRELCADLGLGEHHAFVRPKTFASSVHDDEKVRVKKSGGGGERDEREEETIKNPDTVCSLYSNLSLLFFSFFRCPLSYFVIATL